MPRDHHDDDRPRRRSYDDDRPKSSGNSTVWIVLLVVGLVVGVPLLICGGMALFGVFALKGAAEWAMAMQPAESFFSQLSTGNTQFAYDQTSPAFKAGMSKAQLDDLVKRHPILGVQNSTTPTNPFVKPTGAEPNRKVTLNYTIDVFDPSVMDEDEDEDIPPKPKKPAPPGNKPKADMKSITCTVIVAEQPDKTWKVDSITVP